LTIIDYQTSFVGGKDVDEEIFSDIKTKFDTQNSTNLDLTEGRVYKILLNEIDKFKNKLSANKKNKLYLEGLIVDKTLNDFILRDDITENLSNKK